MKPNLKVATSEHANGREQIAFSLQTPHIFIQFISFFVKIPLTNSLAIPRKENFNIEQMCLLSVCRWLLRNPKRHSKTNCLAGFESLGKVHAHMSISQLPP